MESAGDMMEQAIKSAEENKQSNRLQRLGFKFLGNKVRELKDAKRKMAIAYEHYRFVTQEKIDDFNRRLREKSKSRSEWKELAFSRIEDYDKCPPDNVLDSLEKAQAMKCFDNFEVAYIREVKDPIIFGRITNCTDRFFIDQWDDDVSIDDLINKNEG